MTMSTPDLIIAEVPQAIETATVVIEGPPGAKGDKGDPGIIVSATPPADPQENDLWVDIS